MSSPVDGLSYHQNLFADRQEIIDLVCGSVKQLRQGPPLDQRVVRCYGVTGSGKSWLLCHLQQIIVDEYPGVLALRLCLVRDPTRLVVNPATYLRPPPADAQIIIVELSRWLIERVIAARGATPAWIDVTNDPQRLSERLNNEIATTGKPLVLLVDGLDEHSQDVIQAVEQYCLLPLLQRRDVLLILAVRLPPSYVYPWSRELVFRSQDLMLTPFSPPDVQDQLKKAAGANLLSPIKEEQANEIILRGGGYPLNNYSLARALDPHSGTWTNPGQTFRSEADRLLAPVDARLRSAFDALCVLRQFDEHRMDELFRAYGVSASPSIAPTDLTRTRLAVWDDRAKAYVTDEALRRLLENALYFEDGDRWRKLHKAARDLYRDWSSRYPGTASRWRAEMAFHEQCLAAGRPLLP